jgi:hypothetical protein
MQSQPKGQLLALFPALLSTLSIATPALAESNWLIAEESGSKPNRVMVLVDFGAVTANEVGVAGKGSFIEMPLKVIYESAAKPDFSSMQVRNFCSHKSNDTYNPATVWRDGRRDNTPAGVAHMPSKAMMDNLLMLTCDDTKKALATGQFQFISGAAGTNPDPKDYPWQSAWRDGDRPTAKPKTPATIAIQPTEIPINKLPDNLTMAQRQAIVDREVAKLTNLSETMLADMKSERRFNEELARYRSKRRKTSDDHLLLGWVGQTPDKIARKWGSPYESSANSLEYELRLDWYHNNGNGPLARTDQCFVTFELFEGRVLDVFLQGYSCQLALDKQPSAFD